MYEIEWGAGLGKVESMRPTKHTVQGETPVCVIVPRRPDGGLDVVVQSQKGAISALRHDEKSLAFAEWETM